MFGTCIIPPAATARCTSEARRARRKSAVSPPCLDCTPWVRQENGDRLTGLDCAGMKLGRRLTWPAKRKRALLGSNPPRNSRPETHGDAADAGGWCLPASLLMGWVGHWASP